jgi:hypothetical protein
MPKFDPNQKVAALLRDATVASELAEDTAEVTA